MYQIFLFNLQNNSIMQHMIVLILLIKKLRWKQVYKFPQSHLTKNSASELSFLFIMNLPLQTVVLKTTMSTELKKVRAVVNSL